MAPRWASLANLFRPARLVRPKSVGEAISILEREGDRALILGGGTLIHGLAFKGGLGHVETLVDIQDLGLDYITKDAQVIRIGSAVTFSKLASSSIFLTGGLEAFGDFLQYPPPQIRNRGTVGGALCAGMTLLDLPTVLVSLGASMIIVGVGGERRTVVEDFVKGYFETDLRRGEILREVSFNKPSVNSASAFLKLETNSNDLAIVNVAVSLDVESGRVKHGRVAFGGGTPGRYVRGIAAEEKLVSNALTSESVERLVSDVDLGFKPISDVRASSRYREKVYRVLLGRAIIRCMERLGVK